MRRYSAIPLVKADSSSTISTFAMVGRNLRQRGAGDSTVMLPGNVHPVNTVAAFSNRRRIALVYYKLRIQIRLNLMQLTTSWPEVV